MKRLTVAFSLLLIATLVTFTSAAEKKAKKPNKKVGLSAGATAPEFRFKSSDGKEVDLAKLTEKGPVLVRLTCGCSGCDKELAYFQSLHEAYKGKGLTSIAIFREPDKKVEQYVKKKKLNMLYAVDSKGDAWKTFKTKVMPSNFLIEKGGKIKAVATGCEPSGLIAEALSGKVAELLKTEAVELRGPKK